MSESKSIKRIIIFGSFNKKCTISNKLFFFGQKIKKCDIISRIVSVQNGGVCMQTSVLNTYNQLTVQDQEKVTTFIYSLFSKYKKTSAKKTLSAEDEELFNHFTGSLSLDSDSIKTINKNKSEKYGIK